MKDFLTTATFGELLLTSIGLFLILGGILFFTFLVIQRYDEMNKTESYLKENQYKIDHIKWRIKNCNNLYDFSVVKIWATAAAENIGNDIYELTSGSEYAKLKSNSIIRDVKHDLSSREEFLANTILLEKELNLK